jgi:chitinase
VTINGPYTGKPTLPISFTSTVSELYDSTFTYMWSFGDGSTSNVADPTHTYAVIGTYNVSLTVTGQYAESTTVTSTASIIAQGTGPTLKGKSRVVRLRSWARMCTCWPPIRQAMGKCWGLEWGRV